MYLLNRNSVQFTAEAAFVLLQLNPPLRGDSIGGAFRGKRIRWDREGKAGDIPFVP
jgi:hypothetical protein